MDIRPATVGDLDELERIFAAARRIMRESGNPTQWAGGYPSRDLVLGDIERGECHVVEHQGRAVGTFMFAIGDDPTYAVIHNGAWLDDGPYGVLHRVASDGTVRGVLPTALDFCGQRIDSLRIDTHEDNAIMQHILEREGFARCGIIHCHDGSPRIAYQRIR